MKTIIILLNLLFYFGYCIPVEADAIIGKWENPDGGRKIEIFKKDNLYFGKIISVNDKGAKVKKDDIVLKSIKFENQRWQGKIRVPAKDEDFEAEMTMPSMNRLQFVVRYGMMSRTKTWKRIP